MRRLSLFTCMLTVALLSVAATLRAAVNESINVQAKKKDNPQNNPGDLEGHFTKVPTADKDEIHVTNPNVSTGTAGVYSDPVNDGAILWAHWDSHLWIEVEGRKGIGAMYWVKVTLRGVGSLGDPLWADVEDVKKPGALVLRDKNSGRCESDSTDGDSDAPTLYGSVAADGDGDVEFWLTTGSGTYDWAIRHGTTSVASGTLASPSYKSELLNVIPELYVLELTQSTNPAFKRTINFVVVSVNVTVSNGGSDLDLGDAVEQDGTEVPDNEEESEGAYLLVNWDDDDADVQMNADGTFSQLPVPDLTETSVANEDNLAHLVPNLTPSALDSGIVELMVTAGANKIKLWTQKTKGTEVALTPTHGKIWDLSDPSQRADFASVCQNGFWIEGVAASSSERDVGIVLRYQYGSQLSVLGLDTVKATVVMINLANAAYRDADLTTWLADDHRGHASLVTHFLGPCTRAALLDDDRFRITDATGAGISDTRLLSNITSMARYPRQGCYTNPAITYVGRLRVLAAARALVSGGGGIAYEWNDAVNPSTWNGCLNTITTIRCDSLVEVCYEVNEINVWAMLRDPDQTYNYNIASQADNWTYNETPGTWVAGGNGDKDNLEEHNDLDKTGWADTLMPATQAGYVAPEDARTQFTRRNLCHPIGSTGGNQ